MRKSLVLICGVAMFLGINVASMAETKIAVVDVQKILAEAPQVKTMRDKLQNQFEPRQKELTNLQKDLQANVEKLSKNSSVMKDEEKKELQDKIAGQQKKLREEGTTFQQSLMTAQEQTMQTISKQIQAIVEVVAKKSGYDVVLAKGAAAYSDAKYDITADVIKELKK